MVKSSLIVTVLRFIFLSLLALSVSRIFLVWDHISRIDSLLGVSTILVQGLRTDLVVVGYFFTIPLLLSVWVSQGRLSKVFSCVINVWIVTAFTAVVFMEVVTPEFIAEYDVRPNRLFIDYLAYPEEVSSMLWEGYKSAIFVSVLSLFFCVYVGFRLIRGNHGEPRSSSFATKLSFSALIIIIGFVAMRSSVQHRPFNPSMVFFTNDNLINSLVLNSSYSVLYAAYSSQSEAQASDFYGEMSPEDIVRHVRQGASESPSDFISSDVPTLQFHEASNHGKPKNIVVLLQESLGSRYVGALGGEDLTPNLDSLIGQSWSFTNAYATGTRSVRGIEAVFTGFSPGPSESVVKLGRSQTNFFSIASLLKDFGYHTQFIYGGESHFDNMKSFLLGNGVDDIRDLSSFETKPLFKGSWGASDEDLYEEAHYQLDKLSKQGEPFFSLVFTTSNHSPWEFPDSCTESLKGERQTRENAIRYSDCALGNFFRKARSSAYWGNTVFLIIADHDSRAYGSDLVPIDHFRIPALFIGQGITTHVDNRLVSQIDFPPTLLSIAGISAAHPMIGYDLTREFSAQRQRAILQYGDNFAWMDQERITIMRPNLEPKVFAHNGDNFTKELDSVNYEELIRFVRANALWSGYAYSKGLYRPVLHPEMKTISASLKDKSKKDILTNG